MRADARGSEVNMPTGFAVGNQWREVADTPAAGNFAAMSALVSKAGNPPNTRPSFAAIGDSFLRGGWQYTAPWTYATVGSITGVNPEGLQQLIGSGTYTLTVNADLTVSFNGGPNTTVYSGYNIIPGPTGIFDGAAVRINRYELAAGSLTLTRTGSRADESFGTVSPLAWAQIFSGQSVEFVNYAASGLRMRSLADDGLTGLIAAGAFTSVSGVVLCVGTNDASDGRTLAQFSADAASVLDRLDAMMLPTYVMLQPNYRTAFDAAGRARMAAQNAWVTRYARTKRNVIVLNAFASMAPETGTTIRTAYNADGTHPADTAAQLAGYMVWQAMGSPYADIFQPSADTSSFATTAPEANYLATQYLIGNNSGLPTTPAFGAKVDTNATSTWSKVARTDGIAGEWLRCVHSMTADLGDTRTALSAAVSTPSGGLPANYTRMRLFAEVDCTGVTICPDIRLQVWRSGSTNRFARSSVNSISTLAMPIPTWRGVLKTAPILVTPGDDGFGIQFQCFGTNGTTSAQAQFGRVLINQAV